jgi:hypothetical protein
MNDVTRVFLEGMLLKNSVFMTFVGALFVVVIPRAARSSWAPAARFGVVLFFATLVGGTVAGAVIEPLIPFVYIGVALLSVRFLLYLGELREEWMGMPATVLAMVPLVGMQAIAGGAGEFAHTVASAGGNSLGFFFAFMVIGAIRESSRISEARPIFKTNPVVLFSMAIFALAMAGFVFW